MDLGFDSDELAGVADLFGGLTRDELDTALAELAFRRGDDVSPDAVEAAVARARSGYRLLAVEHGGVSLLVAGPAAFPTLPAHADDLPHILDTAVREVDRDALAGRVRDRLVADAEAAVESGDTERAADLLDVTYDAETWAPVDLSGVRTSLADAL